LNALCGALAGAGNASIDDCPEVISRCHELRLAGGQAHPINSRRCLFAFNLRDLTTPAQSLKRLKE
jgi:hypothetical protein